MKNVARFRPSPAMVVATLALLVALGGTSVAAVSKLAPKNSVGSDQVINGSLRNVDFKADQFLATDTVSRSFNQVNLAGGDELTTVGTLQIPQPGAYLIWAHAQVVSPTVYGARCELQAHGIPNGAGGVPDIISVPSIIGPEVGTNAPTMWMTLVHGFAQTGGSVELACGGSKLGAGARNIKITAVRLGGGD
jgi:hypothetical protein